MSETASLETHAWWAASMAAAEQGDGWLDACIGAGRYVVPCRELVDSLAEVLLRLADGEPVLEVCAGAGELALALAAAGVPIVAVDVDPPPGTAVLRMSAVEALAEHRPAVVLGSFVPLDSGVDAAVLDGPSVRHYVVLCGQEGSRDSWMREAWQRGVLHSVRDWMITRHDVWLGPSADTFLRHGNAWLFTRKQTTVNG